MPGGLDEILQTVPALRDRACRVAPLAGGITNHNYSVEVDGTLCVLRIGGEHTDLLGIDRKCEEACARAAAAAGVAPAVLCSVPEARVLVTAFAPGEPLSPERGRDPAVLGRVAASLRRYHERGARVGSFSAFDTVRRYHALARERGVPIPRTMGAALTLLEGIENALHDSEPPCPCHNDLLPANLLDDGTHILIIDWEYAGVGDRFFDLGNFAVNHDLDRAGEEALLRAYFGEVHNADLRHLRLMRLASDMREALWGFLQAGISTLDFDFLGYGCSHLERFLQGCEVLFGEGIPA